MTTSSSMRAFTPSFRTNCQLKKAAESNSFNISSPKKDGFVIRGRSEFKDRTDLITYIANNFQMKGNEATVGGRMARYGKYQRLNERDEPIFTFGDPILDLVTDDYGDISISGRKIPLGRLGAADPMHRGGISTLDLSSDSKKLREAMLADAASGAGAKFILACNTDHTWLASKNPSQQDIFVGSAHMRFKAWKNSYLGVYWTMGAEIETWGGDFDRAVIQSRYLGLVEVPFCATVKLDSDQDSNDDYVDEYEWGMGISSAPTRVISLCSAQWKGQSFSGQVEAGQECWEIG
jgi:hypothetical protein